MDGFDIWTQLHEQMMLIGSCAGQRGGVEDVNREGDISYLIRRLVSSLGDERSDSSSDSVKLGFDLESLCINNKIYYIYIKYIKRMNHV